MNMIYNTQYVIQLTNCPTPVIVDEVTEDESHVVAYATALGASGTVSLNGRPMFHFDCPDGPVALDWDNLPI